VPCGKQGFEGAARTLRPTGGVGIIQKGSASGWVVIDMAKSVLFRIHRRRKNCPPLARSRLLQIFPGGCSLTLRVLNIHRAKPALRRLVGGTLNGAGGKACKTIFSTTATFVKPCFALSQSSLSASFKSSKKVRWRG
jgi:hypothetical protein